MRAHDYTVDGEIVRRWAADLWGDYKPEVRGGRWMTRAIALWSLLGVLADVLIRRH